MKFDLRYGQKTVEINLNKKPEIFNIKEIEGIKNIYSEIERAVEPLNKLLKNKNRVLVILEDKTRTNPEYKEIIKILINKINEVTNNRAQINLLVALGTHKKHTPADDIKIYGNNFGPNVKLFHHDPDNSENLVSFGKLSTGNELFVNRLITDSDIIIATGNIVPHSFAGFTGGRKAILPGISGRETIRRNHAMVKRDGVGLGVLEGNPINMEMMEAAEKVGLTFIINFVRNDKKEIVKIVAGNYRDDFYEGVKFSRSIYEVKIGNFFDVVIASCGGYPKDINLYQAQKALTVCSKIVKPGGTIILLAECAEGVGQEIFAEWLRKYTLKEILDKNEDEIEVEGHRAYLTARILKMSDVIILSELKKDEVESLHFIWKKNIDEAIEFIKRKHKNYSCCLLPNASSLLPVIN